MADLLIPFARQITTRRMVHAAQVDRGDACGCVCPECGAPLTARQGERNVWHFAHKARNPNCTYTPETSLHEGAKQILADEARVFFPALYARYPSGYPYSTPAENAGWALLHDVSQEYRGLSGVVPDVYGLQADGTPLAIEIRVAHPVPREKIARLAQLQVQTLEIVLGSWRGSPASDYRAPVLQTADRHWLWHPRQAAVDKALADEVEAARRAAAERQRREAERIRAAAAAAAEQRRLEEAARELQRANDRMQELARQRHDQARLRHANLLADALRAEEEAKRTEDAIQAQALRAIEAKRQRQLEVERAARQEAYRREREAWEAEQAAKRLAAHQERLARDEARRTLVERTLAWAASYYPARAEPPPDGLDDLTGEEIAALFEACPSKIAHLALVDQAPIRNRLNSPARRAMAKEAWGRHA